jgi:hypothetical protein
MITITDVKNKYKQLKYQHLKKVYDKNLAKLPGNCKYNKQIKLQNSSKINICSFNLEDSFEVDLCYKPEHAKPCNAFCPRKSKEQLYLEFTEAIKDDRERATNFKDINMLYWLYPDLKDEEFPEKEGFFKRLWGRMKESLNLVLK